MHTFNVVLKTKLLIILPKYLNISRYCCIFLPHLLSLTHEEFPRTLLQGDYKINKHYQCFIETKLLMIWQKYLNMVLQYNVL
jgi:hypothetical protein